MIKWDTLLPIVELLNEKGNGRCSERQQGQTWGHITQDNEVKNMILRDLMGGDKDFLNA